MRIHHTSKLAIVFGSLLAVASSGCSTTSLMKTSEAILTAPVKLVSGKSTSPSESVAKLLCLWEPAEGQGLDEKPSRGFAGQIMFFEHGKPTPVQVEGDVVVYVYKNFHPNDEEHTLLHTFKFDASAWQAHLAKGTLGDSYSVFLPFTEKHRERIKCALRVELILKNGRKVTSPYTEVALAGKKSVDRKSFAKNRQIGGNIEPALPEKQQPSKKRLDTLTLSMPQN